MQIVISSGNRKENDQELTFSDQPTLGKISLVGRRLVVTSKDGRPLTISYKLNFYLRQIHLP